MARVRVCGSRLIAARIELYGPTDTCRPRLHGPLTGRHPTIGELSTGSLWSQPQAVGRPFEMHGENLCLACEFEARGVWTSRKAACPRAF
jgi:hypothetical protein